MSQRITPRGQKRMCDEPQMSLPARLLRQLRRQECQFGPVRAAQAELGPDSAERSIRPQKVPYTCRHYNEAASCLAEVRVARVKMSFLCLRFVTDCW